MNPDKFKVVGQCIKCGGTLTMDHECLYPPTIKFNFHLTKEQVELIRRRLEEDTQKHFEKFAEARRESWKQAKNIVLD
jgi:hypothetical protein